jgi:hypothetical protein
VLPAGAYFLIQLPAVQTYLTRHIVRQVSASLNAKFEVGRVEIAFFNKIILRDINIQDQQGEILLKANRLIATLQYFDRSKKNIHFNQIKLQNAEINLRSDEDSVLNLRFIVDALTSDNADRKRWEFVINAVILENSGFTYLNYYNRHRDSGIDFRDISIKDLNLLANRIHTTTDSIHFNIKYLNFQEKSGFTLNHFSSENSISRTGMDIGDLNIVTPLSRLNLDYLNMSYAGLNAFSDFANRVTLGSRFSTSMVSTYDVAYFAPRLREIDMDIVLSGEVAGRINNLKGTGINIGSLKETSLLADFNMIGLPDFSDTFIFLDLHEFNSSSEEILQIIKPGSGNSDISNQLAGVLPVLGKINYKGKFTGFIYDFVAFGEFNSELGTLVSDLSLRPDSDNTLSFSGKLKAIHFDAGSLARSNMIGRISFNAGLSGLISPSAGIQAHMEGIIDSVFIFDYNYNNIQLEGHFADRKYEGSAKIEDPNIFLDFLGSIDLSEKIPVFDFSATINHARLYDLKLTQDDPTIVLSFASMANFRGDNLDNLNGKIELMNVVFEKEDHFFATDSTILEATGSGDNRLITLSSSLAEVRIEGNYEFATFLRSVNHLVYNYLPSYVNNQTTRSELSGNRFKFSLLLKETESFTEFFIPHISLAPDTRMEGYYDPAAYQTRITGHSDEFRFNNNRFVNVVLDSNSTDSLFTISSGAGYLYAGNRFYLENISLASNILNDSIIVETGWDNREAKKYKGDLYAVLSFQGIPEKKKALVNFDIKPSRVIIADSLWHVEPGRITMDSTSWQVDNFIFRRNDQHLKIHGKLSESLHDSLHLEFQNVDLQNIELIARVGSFHLAGIIDGSASLANVRKEPVFSSSLEVRELYLNHLDYGDLKIFSRWENADKNIYIHTFSDREDDRIINIEGHYYPRNNGLDFDIVLNRINLRTFDGYLDAVFANIRGFAGGNLKLNGTVREPQFNGKINLQRAMFMVDYLKTQYNVTHELAVANNNLVFNDLVLYDSQHNTCRVNGTLTSRNFSDFSLNIYLYPERFMALNTAEKDNELFYGRVFASGLVHITGPVSNLTMNISARTERNTRFFIPLQKGGELNDIHFLTFINDPLLHSAESPGGRNYDIDLAGIQLNFDLDVTPEAEVQIIFDSKIGDIIRGRGNGSFKMEINTAGRFNMFGEYTIEQGDYLFTLQNVINKRFDIERGGRIFWNGDPFDASVDLSAVYRLRAPLNTLMSPYLTGTEERYTRRIPVECQIIMKEKLMTPDITFNIELPTADQDTRRNVQGILNTEEKRSRQFLSLLVLNNFLPEQDMAEPGRAPTFGMSATEASKTTVSEFFSNQLSNWLSQLSRDVDFGFNWRPGDDITPDEVALALSTQVFNDRVSINGHVDVSGRQTNTSNIVGDMDVDIKLNRSGKLRLKAFTRANDNLIRPHLSPYTQGIGLFYREDFDSFDELLSRYWNRIFPLAINEEGR